MIIEPKVRGFMCTTAHPDGCAANVLEQVNYVKSQGKVDGPKRVLVLGASTGYGLASRISAAFGCGADTLGVFFEKAAAGKRTASAGWYNAAAFEQLARTEGLYAKSLNGDAFSSEMKDDVIEIIKADMGQVDLVIYSLAAPRRVHPVTGEVHSSTLKPIGQSVTSTELDPNKEVIKTLTAEAASQEEIDNTVAVMGGEDWEMWMSALSEAGVLAEGCKTTAYTYIGEKATQDIYWNGTIGAAKKDLDRASKAINQQLAEIGGHAYVSVLKAVVTQSSAAIPNMTMYLALLFKVMKEQGTHEGCIEQVYGLFKHCLYGDSGQTDADGRLRMDGKELEASVQQAVEQMWPQVNDDNVRQITDVQGYQDEFLRLFGFGLDGVDYAADTDPLRAIGELVEKS